jgi:hypothetical protein
MKGRREDMEKAGSEPRMIEKYLNSDSGIIKYALAEFRHAGWMDESGNFPCDAGDDFKPQERICLGVLKILKIFSEQGHSGLSASYSLNLLGKLLRFEPITPLLGMDNEWTEVGEGSYQNRRCSHVFKDKERFDGQAYDIEAVIFRKKNGDCYTDSESIRAITFPYTPRAEYKDAPEQEEQE